MALLCAAGAVTYCGTVKVADDWRDGMARDCRSVPGVAEVPVPSNVVAYARRQGWPSPNEKSSDELLADPLTYDHGWQADRVRAEIAELCRGEKYRLVVR
jgi:hypothetical protein